MTSTHPDFAGVDSVNMTDADMLRHFNDNRVEPTRLLNGKFLAVDSAFDAIDTAYGMGYRWKS